MRAHRLFDRPDLNLFAPLFLADSPRAASRFFMQNKCVAEKTDGNPSDYAHTIPKDYSHR
jgi:hypothetical protein